MHWGAKLSQKGGEKECLISDADTLWLSFSTSAPIHIFFAIVCYSHSNQETKLNTASL